MEFRSMDPFGAIPGGSEYIDAVFGPEGYLAQRFPGYQPRSGQLALTRAVDQALVFGNNLMAEAGCGTGKSVGYLVPATYHAQATNPRTTVVVVTANIALQEQLIKKDLPLLAEILPWGFTFGLLKGKNNFGCIDRLVQIREKGIPFYEGQDREELLSLLQWLENEIEEGGTGDVSDLDFQPSHKMWSEISVGPDDCKGSDCKFKEECFANESQRLARKCDVIVTNYHMLFSHLKLVKEAGVEFILPSNFQIAILDEAHKAADIAREFFGFRLTSQMFNRAANGIRSSPWAGLVGERANLLFDEIKSFKESNRYKTRVKEPMMGYRVFTDAFCDLDKVSQGCLLEYKQEISRLIEERDKIASRFGTEDETTKEFSRRITHIDKRRFRLEQLLKQTKEVLEFENRDDSVYFIEMEGRKNPFPVIRSKPLNVGSILREYLFEKTKSVICTSATLTTNGNFDYTVRELGCPHYDQIIAESPFDFRKQALLVVPEGMTDPADRELYPFAVAEAFCDGVEMAQGRTLGLFTSYKNLEHAAERFAKLKLPYRLLKHGDKARTKLIEEFKTDTNSVLIGTESFWAGVDVPGDALSLVVIDRIPFPNPDDPIIDAIASADPSWFQTHAIPRAIIALKQGFGRLIRSINDRGVVVILDRRLLTKGYGKSFLRSLPNVAVDTNLQSIKTFFSKDELSDEEFIAQML